MSNTPATFKQRDLQRAIRAAMIEGKGALRVRATRAGDILIEHAGGAEATPEKPVAAREDIEL